jgi:citrate lyase subunit beta/citryl-CoA lyase
MKPYRSFLFVPGNNPRMLQKAPTIGADALLLDLEDAVPVDAKAAARALVADVVGGKTGKPIFVRVNSVATDLTRDDLAAVVRPGLQGVFLAKTESADEVRQVAAWLDELEASAALERGVLDLVCMLESANSVRIGYDIGTASPRVASVCYSGAENGDLQTDLGCEWSPEGTEMLYARSKIVLDARAAGIEHPLEGVYAEIENIDGLIADTTLSRRLGYKGRAVIHPSHVDPVNRVYSPQPQEVAYFRGMLAAFEEALAAGRGAVRYEGRMIDYAMAARARRVLALDEAIRAGRLIDSPGAAG